MVSGSRGGARSVGAVLAVVVLVAAGGLVPVWQYVDAVTVPGGVEAQRAEVLDVDTPGRPNRARFRGRTLGVRLPDGSEDTVYVSRRLNFPDPGDTLTVYREDGELRTTSERSLLGVVGGGLVSLLALLATLAWLRSRRRTGPAQDHPHV